MDEFNLKYNHFYALLYYKTNHEILIFQYYNHANDNFELKNFLNIHVSKIVDFNFKENVVILSQYALKSLCQYLCLNKENLETIKKKLKCKTIKLSNLQNIDFKKILSDKELQDIALNDIKNYRYQIFYNKFENFSALSYDLLKNLYIYNSKKNDKLKKSLYQQISFINTIYGQKYLKQHLKRLTNDKDLMEKRKELIGQIYSKHDVLVNILRTLPSYKIELNIIQSGNVQYKQTESLNESLLNNLEIETDMDFYIKCSETVIGLAVLSTKIGHLNDFLNSVLIETISFEDIHFLSKFVKIDFEHKFELQHKLIGYIPEGLNQYLDVALVLYKENACEFNKYLHDTILKDGKCDLKIYFTGEKVFLKTKKENLNLHSKMIIEFEYENHAFLTNSKINNFNFKIRQCLDQIFEIYGKICYNIIKKGDFISKIKRPVLKICEIDLCCSIIITYIKNNNKINVLHSKNTDFLEEECVMNINNTVPCYLFSDHKDLKHTDFFTNKNVNILHGPNSSGKTSFVINIIQRIILNQIGFYSFNKNDKIKTFDELKYINDLSHVSDITSIKNNTFVFIDELLIDENLLDQLIKKNVFVIYVLHDIDFIKKDLLDSINIYKMENYTIFPNKACSSNALSIMEKHLYKELYECILLEYNNMYKK